MKLRNKLAAVLATAMVVTSVPVVTMAASGNTLSTSKVTVTEDHAWNTASTAPVLQVEFKSKPFAKMKDSPEVFYLELDNAEWLMSGLNKLSDEAGNVQVDGQDYIVDGKPVKAVVFDRQSDDIVKVTVNGAPDKNSALFEDSSKKLNLPVLATVTDKGDVTLKLTSGGGNSTITEGSWVIASTSDEVGTASVGSAKSFNKSGKIANITFKEAYAGAFYLSGGHNYAIVELNDSDYEFDLGSAVDTESYYLSKSGDNYSFSNKGSGTKYSKYKVEAEYLYGFGSINQDYVYVYATADKDSIYVELPSVQTPDSIGQLKLKAAVTNAVKNPSQGELTVDIKGNIEDVKKAVVANVGDYDAVVKTKDDKIVDILAGQSEEVTFMIDETIAGTFTKGRDIEVTIENGYFIDAVVDEDNEDIESLTDAALRDAITTFEWTVDGDKEASLDEAIIKDYVLDKDNRVVGFTFAPNPTKEFSTKDANGFKFTMDINTRVTDSGNVTLKVESRDLDKTIEGTIATAKAGLKVESDAAVLKVGLKNQVTGKMTITELQPEFLQKGEDLVIYLPKLATGIDIDEDNLPTVKVTSGDLKLGDVDYKTGLRNKNGDKVDAIVIPVKQSSDTASTIEISDFNFTVDRTAPEGTYDVYVGGKAVSDATTKVEADKAADNYDYLNQAFTAKDFIVIGTANTEDLTASNGLTKGTASFVIGKAEYTGIDGKAKTMDAASYIQDPGYTMIPVRYVAEAFGVDSSNILFSKGVATIFAGSRTIQLTSGSDIAVVNGAQVTMGTKVVIKDGRTYVPVGEIARILGITTSWDSTTKTATFTNK